jgi:L-asparaginase
MDLLSGVRSTRRSVDGWRKGFALLGCRPDGPARQASLMGGNQMHYHRLERYPIVLVVVLIALTVAWGPASARTPGQLPNVVILATGGTIAGTAASSTTTVGYDPAKIGVETLINAVPELKKVASVKGEQVFQIASENMNNDYWLKLAKRVNELLKQSDVDGIVITHGTDTIEETAYFLDLVVKSDKPVVIVGAMRPSTAISADGPINLYNSVILAGSEDAVGKGVLVAMNDQINAAREVTKSNTSTADTFRTPELGMLGYMQDNKPHFYRESIRKHTRDTEFDVSNLDSLPQVDIVYGYANMNRIPIDAFVAAGAKGIVHAGVGDGSLARPAIEPALIEARKKGVIIVRSSRVGNGIVARNGEAKDDELDFVVSDTLNPQKARILLMLGLTKTNDTKEIQRMFYTY